MDVKTPLLLNEDPLRNEKHNDILVNSLRCNFFSKLPQKVKYGIDPEAPFEIDISKTKGLIEGKLDSLKWLCFVCVLVCVFIS